MKITGTKKLLIILLALACAIAAGLGVLFGSSGGSAQTDSALAYEEELITENSDGEKDGGDFAYDETVEETAISEDCDELTDEQTEEEYDERYDEEIICRISEELGIDYATVNFYLRANGLDANELAVKVEEEAAIAANPELNTQSSSDESVLTDILSFTDAYRDGEVTVDEETEDKDWFVAPDESATYVNFYWYDASVYGPSFNGKAYDYFTEGTGYVNLYFTLAPGEQLVINTVGAANAYNYAIYRYYIESEHWASVVNFCDWPDAYYENTYIVSGDAPTGTILSWYHRAPKSYYVMTTGGGAASIWYYNIVINRLNPQKTILADGDSGSSNTKTVYFDGSHATISLAYDYGSYMLTYEVDSQTELIQRSQHGNEGGTYFIFGSTYTGKHEITIRPNTAYGVTWSDGTTTAIKFYLVVLERQITAPGMQRDGTTVSANGKTKTVHATGDYLYVTFTNYNPSFMEWASNGLEADPDSTVSSDPDNVIEGYDEANGTLTLRQKEQGAYTINISLKNPEGCSWSVGGTSIQQFYFNILEMYIKALPDMVEQPGKKTITFDYTGDAKSFTITPAINEQLVIVSSGIETELLDRNGDGENESIRFSMTDAGKANITIQPAQGYVWPDGTTKEIVYTITINPAVIDAPRLAAYEATESDGVTKRVGYVPGWNGATLTIENIPEEAISYTSALQKVSWTDDDVLVLLGTEALTYPVQFTLISTNYQWKSTAALKTFYLQIDRYMLSSAYIIVDGDADKIEGTTKTVSFEDFDPDNYLRHPYDKNYDSRYFNLFTGGLLSTGQIEVDFIVSIAGRELELVWDSDGQPIVSLWGNHAANYIINITPTSNYCWDTTTDLDDPDTEMVTFKFVINAIAVDNVTMYVESSGTGGTAPVLTREAYADYDGTEKHFWIGTTLKDGADIFIGEQMVYSVYSEPTLSDLNQIQGKNDINYSGVLEWCAVHSGTYVIKLELRDTDYCWRDGSGTEVLYTFTIKQQAIGTPVIIEDECGGNDLYFGATYIDGVYDGNVFTMVIYVPKIELINIELDPDGSDNDPDPETGVDGKGVWRYERDDGSDYDRIIIQARNVGTHICYLSIDPDSNYCWDEEVPGYEFQIRVDFAQISGVTFYFESNGSEEKIGSDGSFYTNAVYSADYLQHLVVRRSIETEFAYLPFNRIFTYEITANNGHITTVGDYDIATDGDVNYSLTQLSLGLCHADSYLIKIYPTSNYKWAGVFFTNTPYTCFIQVNPRQVDLPLIVEGQDPDDETISNSIVDPTKSVIYNRDYRTIDLDLGADWKAFKVVYASQGLTVDASNNRNDHFVYRAIDAYTYELGLSLTDENDYQWDGNTTHTYYFIIGQRTVDVPDAYLIDCDDVSDWIIANKDKSIDPTDGDFTYNTMLTAGATNIPVVTYTKSAYRVYFYGEIVSKTRSGDTTLEVNITMTGSDASNADLITYGEVAQQGIKVGYYCSATQVNVYSISIVFRDNQFNVPNYQWGDNGFDTIRTFEFEIEKMVVSIPEIDYNAEMDPDPDFVPNPDNSGAENYAYFVYGNKAYSITISNVLSSALMTYINDTSLTSVGSYSEDASGIGSILFSTIHAANVGGEYKLTLRIDDKNQRWDSLLPDGTPNPDDIDDKYFYIVINKLPVTAPSIVEVTPPSATISYDTENVFVYYNGSPYSVGTLTVSGIDSTLMTYRLGNALTMNGTFDASTQILEVGTTVPDAGTYPAIISLLDPVNMKWDITDESDDLSFNLVIKPKPIAKSEIDTDNSAGWYQGTSDNSPLFSGVEFDDLTGDLLYYTTMDVTYNGNTHSVAIKNFDYYDPNDLMQVKVVSSYKFTNSYYDDASELLIYEAKNVGVYIIQITLSPNAEWDDGTGSTPVNIVLTINKYVYDTPEIYGYDDTDTVTYPNTFTKSVTYILNTEQWLEIDNYNDSIMTLWELTSPSADKPFVNLGLQTGTGFYRFGATHAGTYTVTFRLTDFTNSRWEYADKETITFTFIVNKLALDIPVIDAQFILQGDTLTGGNTTLSATCDALGRTVLVNNVLDLNYMEFKPADSYNTSGTINFVYDSVAIADSSPDGGVTYPTIQDVFGYDSTRVLVGYPGAVCSDPVNRQNYITMSATNTGTYAIVFSINKAQQDNMVWSDKTATDKTVTLAIKKMQVSAPTIAAKSGAVSNSDTSQTVRYTGGYIEFTIQNAFNGCKDMTEWLNYVNNGVSASYEYETHKVNSAISAVSGAKLEVVSWFDGKMVVRAREVGTYSVTISIKDNSTTEWTNTSSTSRTLTFVIAKAEITPSYSFTSTDADWIANPSYASSSQWPISIPVTAEISFNNISVRYDADGRFEKLDLDVAVEFYYIKDGNTLKNNLIIIAPPADLITVAPVGAAQTVVSAIDPSWKIVENNGVMSLVYTYEIPHGTDFISKGTYKMYAVQNGDNGNYQLNSSYKAFTIIADKAPFDETQIIWQYYIDNDPTNITTVTFADFTTLTLTTWAGNSNRTEPLELEYLEGFSYVFNAYLDPAYMAGYDGAGYTDLASALLTYQVKWDGLYTGNQTATYSGTYSVSFKIVARDAEYYSFPDTTYTLYFKIKPVLYNLDGLVWQFEDGTTYDSSYADGTNTYADGTNVYKYVFDGTAHTVKLMGTLPSGLTVSSYLVSGYDLNSQIYAGVYTTAFVFATSNSNYELPVMGDDTTYDNPDGLFVWVVTWEIVKADLEVEWEQKRSDDGTSAYVPVLKEHGEMVDYTYYKKQADGSWLEVTTFEHDASGEWFRIEANLKTSSNPATNYANDYNLVFVLARDDDGNATSTTTDNWVEFFLVGDSVQVTVILGAEYDDDDNYIPGTGKTLLSGDDPENNKFSYNGNEFLAELTLLDTTGDLTLDNVVLTYYSSVNYNKPLTEVPTNPGTYKVKLTLVNLPDNGHNYQLADREFYFLIDKGVFDGDKIYWQYTHEDSEGNQITAKWVEMGTEWLWQITDYADKDGIEVTSMIGQSYVPTYDGLPHTVQLISEDSRLVITSRNRANIDAGNYTTTASFAYDSKKWYSPTDDPLYIAADFEWTIEKKEISLANIKWIATCEDSETDDCVFTISGGTAKKHSVQLDESTFDPYLLNYITYVTTKDGVTVSNSVSDAGVYVTECIIAELPENSNFKLGAWPEDLVDKEFEWEVHQRVIDVPVSVESSEAGYWVNYDSFQHNLLTAVTLPTDWSEYFTISMKFAQHGATTSSAYDGTNTYGYEYTAVNAGTYTYLFAIADGLNTADVTNVVWRTDYDGTSFTPSTDDQNFDLVVAKAAMNITGWNDNREASTVNFTGDYVSELFIGYRFYSGTAPVAGNEVTLNYVLNSEGGKDFVIEPFIKDAYSSNIELTFSTGVATYLYFTSRVLSDKYNENFALPREVFISGYKVGDVTHTFTDDEWKSMMREGNIVPDNLADDDEAWETYLTPAYKAQTTVYVIYGGDDVTFIIEKWSYYENHLNIWQGNLTQSDAGDYSVTLLLKQDGLDDPYTARCWSPITDNGDGTYTFDRSAVVLNFQLRYKMLTVPKLEEVTYTGAAYENIIQTSYQIIFDDVEAGDKAYDALLEEYGDFVTITGQSGTTAGSYRLYLTIKDEYVNTIRWYNGTAFGQPGTLIIDWKILPIYIIKPTLSNLTVYYDGDAHSVKEALVGFGDDCTDEEKAALQSLMQNARISSEGSMGVNAGTYNATFSLPDSNYAWMDAATGNVDLEDTASKPIEWTIARKPLDMKSLYWGYYDADGNPVEAVYNEATKQIELEYTYADGVPFEYSLQLLGIPEELKDYIVYGIGDVYGNTKSEVGTYTMWVTFFSNSVDKGNYDVDSSIPLDFLEIFKGESSDLEVTWQIKPRQFEVPEDMEWYFDGTVNDLLEILGFGSEWENYLDVDVEYRELDETNDQFKDYMDKAETDSILGYSIYNVYYLGAYRVNLSIKSGINDADHNRVVWVSGGNTHTSDTSVIISINPLVIEALEWNTDAEREWEATVDVKLPDGISLSDLPADMFDYVIREYNGEGGELGKVVQPEDIEKNGSGYSYAIEFIINPDYSYAINEGAIMLDFDTNDVPNPYVFGLYDFVYPNDSDVYWIPVPVIDEKDDGQTYTAEELSIHIKNWATTYLISSAFRAKYPAYFTTYPDIMESFIYTTSSSIDSFDTATGEIKTTKAGDYNIAMKLNPKLNLSWYDSTQYYVNSNGKLVKIGESDPVADVSSLIYRFAKTVSFTVNKAKVRQLDIERLESLLPTLEYNGLTYNLKTLDECKAFFSYLEREYGNLVTVTDGYTGSQAGVHELVISLTDEDSCYWDLNEKVTESVREEGYEFAYKRVNGSWVLKYVHENGDGTYIDYNGGNYTINRVYKYEYVIDEYVLITDDIIDSLGNIVDLDNYYNTNSDGSIIRYKKLDNGMYEVAADGEYVARLQVDANGDPVLRISVDENYNIIIDSEKSEVLVTYEKQSTEAFKVNWYITSATRTSPYAKTENGLVFTGKAQSAADALENFDPNIMEIIEGATGVNAGTYTAKIVFKDENYVWADTDEDYVIVEWYIGKASFDLTGVTWSYTEETEFVYTIENGKPVVFSVELLNLPDAVKNSIRYTTNNTVGAHAGVEAGRYYTTFEILNLDENFDNWTLPEDMQSSLTWYIQKRVLDLPQVASTWVVFDDEPHNLLDFLELSDNWNDYFDIAITYSDGKSPFIAYNGYDVDGVNGIDDNEKYYAYGAGSYRYYFTIKSGINTTNANVVWRTV